MATAAATDRAVPALAPPPEPPRPRVLLTGTAFATASVVAVFAGLIGIYLAERAQALESAGVWLPEGAAIPLTPPNVAIVTLLMSSVTIQWAAYAIGNDDRPSAYTALGLTVLLAAAFVNMTAVLYGQMGLGLADSTAAVLIYTVTGAHLAMVGAAVLFAGVMAFRALGGQYGPRDREGLQAACLFWHANVAVFAVIWYAIYITK